MITIGIDASRANSKQKTGTEWYSYHLIQELKKIIPENFRVVLYSKDPLTDGLEKLPKNWTSKVLNWPPGFLWTQIRLSLAMANPFTRPDILFVSAHTIPLIHPKTVLVAHDIGFERMHELYKDKEIGYQNNLLKKFLKLLVRLVTLGQFQTTELDYHRWAMRFAIKNAAHLITVSNFSKKEICDFYNYPENKITTVYNGFSQDNYYQLKDRDNPKYQEILKKYNIVQPYVLFIGRKEYKKNIPRLIETYGYLKRDFKLLQKLVLVGNPGFKYEEVEAFIYQFNLGKEVIEPGYVAQEDLNVIMNLADLFILPSLYEGFGIPLLEAMSAGTPVVCSDIPALKEVGGDACQYFNPNDLENIAQTIYKTLHDSQLKDKMILAGLTQIKKFSWPKCAQETWKIIKKQI